MNYQKVYDGIITNAIFEHRQKLRKNNVNYIYYENHHIIPRCLAENEEESNLVLLTAREHYICHKLLCYIYPENIKIIYAFHLMTCFNKEKPHVSSRDYELARSLRSNKSLSKETKEKLSIKSSGRNNGMFEKGYKIKGEKNGTFGKNKHTYGIIIWSQYRKGKTYEEIFGEEKAKQIKNDLSKSHIGFKHTEYSKRKMSIMLKGKTYKLLEKICPFCGLVGKGPNMSRYHFNNCKLFI